MIKPHFFIVFFTAITAFFLSTNARASTVIKKKRSASIVVDYENNKVLQEHYAQSPRYPASLTKMMTLYILFDKLEAGEFTLKTVWSASQKASIQPPSKLGLKTGQTLSVENVIYALVTKSANDVAMLAAESMGGSEASFARMMTKKAHALGMFHTVFKNASGLYHPKQITTARDMVTLARALIKNHPRYYKYFSTQSFFYKGRTYRNHNNLLGAFAGLDGLKTGYINASGYNLAASAVRHNKRIIAVVMGGVKAKARDDHMKDILESGFSLIRKNRKKTQQLYASHAPALPVARQKAGPVLSSSKSSGAKLARSAQRRLASSSKISVNAPRLEFAAEQDMPRILRKESGVKSGAFAAKPKNPRKESEPNKKVLAVREKQKPPKAAMLSYNANLPKSTPKQAGLKTASLSKRSEKALLESKYAPQKLSQLLTSLEDSLSLASPENTKMVSSISPRIPGGAGAATSGADSLSLPRIPSAATGGAASWSIQVGSFKDKKEAKKHLTDIKQKDIPTLQLAHSRVQPFEKDGHLYYRARFVGLKQGQARQTCSFLKENALDCLALAPIL